MKRYLVGFSVCLLVGLLMAGCQQTGVLPEVLTIESRSPSINASGVGSGETLSITFKFPIDIQNLNLSLDDFFSSFGPNHTAGNPNLSSATISWSTHQHTATIEGIQGWSGYGKGTGPGIVEVLAPEGRIKDIFGNELRAGNVLWKYSMPIIIGGVIDPTFGMNGFVFYDGGHMDSGDSIIFDSSGRILVTGYSRTTSPSQYNMAIWRYNADGTPDVSFGNNGLAIYQGSSSTFGQGIVLDPSGKIVVAGYRKIGWTSSEATVWRYNAGGVLDTSFGVNGVATYNGATYNAFNAVALDSAGGIVVTGNRSSGFLANDLMICRYDSSGALDTDFGTNGSVVFSGGGISKMGMSIQIDDSGDILVAGPYEPTFPETTADMVLWKVSADGVPDSSFGINGELRFERPGGIEIGWALRIDPLGRILVGGALDDGADDYFALWRCNSDGTLDNTFGTNGLALFDNGINEHTASLAVDDEGRILVTGDTKYGTIINLVASRFTADGILDTSFGTNGIYSYSRGIEDHGKSLALDSYGRILVTGQSAAGGYYDMVILRLM